MKNIEAIIFDFDGTLADTIPLCITCFRQAVEPLVSRPLSDDEITAAFGPNEEGTIKKFIPHGYKEATEHFLRLYKSLHRNYAEVFDGIPELLQTLASKGVRLALATGKGEEACHFSLSTLGLSSFFEIIETGSLQGSRKEEAIHKIVDAFSNVSNTQTLYVGDSAGDIRESYSAGIRPVAVAWAKTAKRDELMAENPEKLFDSVSSFTEWIMANI